MATRHRDDEDDDDSVDREDPDDSDVDEDDDPPVVSCPYCGKAVSEEAEMCPHCKSFISFEDAPRRVSGWWVAGVVVCLLIVLTWVLL